MKVKLLRGVEQIRLSLTDLAPEGCVRLLVMATLRLGVGVMANLVFKY